MLSSLIVAVAALEALPEFRVDVVVAGRFVLLDLGEQMVLPLGQVGEPSAGRSPGC
jgi:hypothetical protein